MDEMLTSLCQNETYSVLIPLCGCTEASSLSFYCLSLFKEALYMLMCLHALLV